MFATLSATEVAFALIAVMQAALALVWLVGDRDRGAAAWRLGVSRPQPAAVDPAAAVGDLVLIGIAVWRWPKRHTALGAA